MNGYGEFVSDIMMSDRNIRCLTANQVKLVERLHCSEVLMSMASAGIMSTHRKTNIENGNAGQVNERFLQWLEKAPEGTYHDFLTILRTTNQSHLARLLDDWDKNAQAQNTCTSLTTKSVKRKSAEEEQRQQIAAISTKTGRPVFI